MGPCSISLLPITVAYLAGFENKLNPFQKSLMFCAGIVFSLVLLAAISIFLGKVYGQTPFLVAPFVALLALVMGLNLIGILKIPMPAGPNPDFWGKKVPKPLAPFATGLAFGFAASPCTTPVLAVLLGWIAQSQNPIIGILLLTIFGIGQVIPLLIAGTVAASIPTFLKLKPFSQAIPLLSGSIFIIIGVLTLLAQWI